MGFYYFPSFKLYLGETANESSFGLFWGHSGKKKNLPANARDSRDSNLIPGSGRSPGVGNGNPLKYSCLENSNDRGVWQATVHGVAKT